MLQIRKPTKEGMAVCLLLLTGKLPGTFIIKHFKMIRQSLKNVTCPWERSFLAYYLVIESGRLFSFTFPYNYRVLLKVVGLCTVSSAIAENLAIFFLEWMSDEFRFFSCEIKILTYIFTSKLFAKHVPLFAKHVMALGSTSDTYARTKNVSLLWR